MFSGVIVFSPPASHLRFSSSSSSSFPRLLPHMLSGGFLFPTCLVHHMLSGVLVHHMLSGSLVFFPHASHPRFSPPLSLLLFFLPLARAQHIHDTHMRHTYAAARTSYTSTRHSDADIVTHLTRTHTHHTHATRHDTHMRNTHTAAHTSYTYTRHTYADRATHITRTPHNTYA